MSWICLMYHDVTEEKRWQSPGRAYFSVTADTFRRHLGSIEALGLRGRSISDAIHQPQDAVAISFDDGDLGQATQAFPALAARRMTATFFVTTSWVGTPGYASWEQLREMRAAGMSIQSHTHSHPFLSDLGEVEVIDELRRSRDLLDDRLEQQTTMIALPGGDAPRAPLRDLFEQEGYLVVATSRWGRNTLPAPERPRYVKRCTVRGALDGADFERIVTGDRWLSLRKQTRERVLAFARASLGPQRYARWRRIVLDGSDSTTDA